MTPTERKKSFFPSELSFSILVHLIKFNIMNIELKLAYIKSIHQHICFLMYTNIQSIYHTYTAICDRGLEICGIAKILTWYKIFDHKQLKALFMSQFCYSAILKTEYVWFREMVQSTSHHRVIGLYSLRTNNTMQYYVITKYGRYLPLITITVTRES